MILKLFKVILTMKNKRAYSRGCIDTINIIEQFIKHRERIEISPINLLKDLQKLLENKRTGTIGIMLHEDEEELL